MAYPYHHQPGVCSHPVHLKMPSSKLTWQWNITMFNMKCIFKSSIFHCHVSLPKGKLFGRLPTLECGRKNNWIGIKKGVHRGPWAQKLVLDANPEGFMEGISTSWDTTLKTNMTGWKITIFTRRYIDSNGWFSIVMVEKSGGSAFN